jgi:1,4-alpha-glucan branching enzyme
MKLRHVFRLIAAVGMMAGVASAQSTRSGLGAVPYAGTGGTGVTFRTWAPNATTVAVKGAFNGWGSTALIKESSGGTWSIDAAGAKAGQEYKFVVNGAFKKDPRGRRVVNSAGNSIVYDHNSFDWGNDASFSAIWRNDLVVYEMHAGSYNAEDWLPSTFDECADKIAYLKALGISGVQLMPVIEFPGDRSWGYNPSDVFAIEASHGGPDALKRFIKACHANGIAVLVDVVHNHYGPSDLEMWQYDGWSSGGYGGIYFYNDWKANTDWGSTRPDYGRSEVKDFIQAQIQMFVENYHVDGFRWDSVYNIRNCSGTWNQPGSDLLAQVNNWLIANHPDVFRIAEDNAFDTDVGFEAQWDHAFLNDVRYLATAANDADRNMDTLAYHLGNGGFNRVVYVESHDSCGDLNNKHRLPYDVQASDPNGYFPKKRALLANTIALVSSGIPMIFNGSEMHEWYTFSNNQALRWSLTNTYAGIVRAYADLIHLRRNAYGNTGALKDPGNVDVHHVNNGAKVVGMKRGDLLVAINCSATAFTGYTMAFPSAGTWYCLYNSDLQTYNSSFGNVGPAVGGTVVADGSANAPLALGAYSLQIYSKTRLPAASAANFDPAAPAGCGMSVQIVYAPGDGALRTATNVYAHVGRNNWQTPTNVALVQAGDTWTASYPIPDDTYELNVSFTDGDTLWDNNGGADWTVAVANCGDLPAVVQWTPSSPQGCVPVQISYEANGGLLMGATQVRLSIGRNDWKNIVDVPMQNAGGDLWTATYAILDETWQLDFAFHDESPTNRWDNNSGKDWHAVVSACANAEQPQLAITNPAPATAVSNGVTTVALQGTASLLTGVLRWTNTLGGASGALAYSTNWSLASVPLAEGVNLIRVSGTNSAVNPNHGAADSPTNSAYALSATWSDGMNGGAQFKPWRISSGATATLAVSNAFCSFASNSYAWALQASGGGFIQAIRPFAASLQPGDKVSFVFENGGIDSPGSVGVAFQNRFDQRLAETYFEGGTTNYVVNDATFRHTGIPWSAGTKTCTFELLTTLTYRLTLNGQSFDGTFADASEFAVAYVRFWNWNAGSGDDHTFFIGALSITGAPLPVLTYSSEIAVSRAVSTNAPRTTEVWVSTNGAFVAIVDNSAGLESNVWGANALVSNGWNWALLPGDAYAISNNVVTVTPSGTNPVNLISFGKPGGG